MDDVIWCMSDPIESARMRACGSPVPMDEIACRASVHGHGGDVRIRAPVGGFRTIELELRLPLPATRGDILRAVKEFYTRPATPDILRVMKKASAIDLEIANEVEARLASGHRVELVELCLCGRDTGRGRVGFAGLKGDDSTSTYDLGWCQHPSGHTLDA